MDIRTVLCPVDFTAIDDREIDVAVEVCRTFGAKLVLHHNVPIAEPGFSRVWEWAKAHAIDGDGNGSRAVEARLKAALDHVVGVRAEATITSGSLLHAVLGLADLVSADAMVIGSHGWSSQDHASLTERVIDRSPCPVLTFEERSSCPPFRLGRRPDGPPVRALVPTDLSADAGAAVAFACGLVRTAGVEVDLVHVLAADASDASREAAQRALAEVVPADLVAHVAPHVRRGHPVDEIVRYVDATMPAFAVLGTHARGIFRHLFTRDTTRAVLRRADCPVWVVPSDFAG